MPHCHIHGWYSSDDGACVVCRDADARARRGPGDYQCPHCRYISLLKDATRCPMCHGVIDPQLWQRIAVQEVAEAKAIEEAKAAEAKAAEEAKVAAAKAAEDEKLQRERLQTEKWERTRPAREAAERRAKIGSRAKTLVFTPIGCLGGALAGGLVGTVLGAGAELIIGIAAAVFGQHGSLVWLWRNVPDCIVGVTGLVGALVGGAGAFEEARKKK